MDYTAAFAISSAGMSVERTRVDVAALNLANSSSAHETGGQGYVPKRAVVRGGLAEFSAALRAAGLRVPSVTVEDAVAAPRRALDPGHPLADASGFVSYPGIDPAGEMMTLMSATRAYEANVAALNTARALALKALQIGSEA